MHYDIEKTQLSVITDDRALPELYDGWSDLSRRDRKANPFKSPQWLIPWRNIFMGRTLRIIALYINQQLEGIAPLYIHNFTDSNVRELSFLGAGNSDYAGIIVNNDCEEEFITAFFDEVFSCKDWDLLNLSGLREDSGLLEYARNNLPEAEIIRSEVSPLIILPETAGEYDEIIGSKKLKRMRWAERRLSDMGGLTFNKAEIDSLPSALENLFMLHNKSQRLKGNAGVFTDYNMKRFLRRISMDLYKTDLLALYSLRLSDRTIASIYLLKQNEKMYYYIGGYEPELGKYSPGVLCVYNAIKDSISNGMREFDFLKGNEDYKYEWGAIDRGIYSIRVNRNIIK